MASQSQQNGSKDEDGEPCLSGAPGEGVVAVRSERVTRQQDLFGEQRIGDDWSKDLKQFHSIDWTYDKLTFKDIYQKTPLHQFASDNNSTDTSFILRKIGSKDLHQLFDDKDIAGNTPFHLAIENNSMSWIKVVMGSQRIEDEQKLSFLQTCNTNNVTPLQNALELGDLFLVVLKAFPLQYRLHPFEASIETETGATPLHKFASKHPDIISDLLDLLPRKERQKYLMMTDNKQMTALHLAADTPSQRYLLNIQHQLDSLGDPLNEDESSVLDRKLAVLELIDDKKQTVFHKIAVNQERKAYSQLLDCVRGLDAKKRRQLLEKSDIHQMTVFHHAARRKETEENSVDTNETNAQALAELADALEPDDLVEILLKQDGARQTALHYAVGLCYDAVKNLMEGESRSLKSAAKIKELLSASNGDGDTIFHLAADRDAAEIVDYMRQNFRDETTDAIHEARNDVAESALHKTKCSAIQMYQAMLIDLSEDKRSELIKAQDVAGNTVLHLITMSVTGEDENPINCILLLLGFLEKSDKRIVLTGITNNLGGTVLEYILDIEKLPEAIAKEVLSILPVRPHLLDMLDIESLSDTEELKAHQRYALSKLLPHDDDDEHHKALLGKIKETEDRHVEKLKELIRTATNAKDKKHFVDELYKDGNTVLHILARDGDETITRKFLCLLEMLGEKHRLDALNKKNRRGETAYFTAKSDKIRELLGWSKQQEGFYHLSTPPTVLVMYSTTDRQDFDREIEDLLDVLRSELNIVPTVDEADLSSDEIVTKIKEAQMQANMSALIVFYAAHGFSGHVQTKDGVMRIQTILDAMCHKTLQNKPKIFICQSCQVVNHRDSDDVNNQTYNITHPDVVSIAATVNGEVAYRGLMVRKLAEALRNAHLTKTKLEGTTPHLDISQIFYETNALVRKEVKEELGEFRDQICEMRSTLSKMLNLTQIFRPPKKRSNKEAFDI